MPASTPTVMFVHGAWHGSWCWDLVRERLHADGIATAAVDNPSVTRPGSDLAADGDNLRAALDAIDGPGRCWSGHSYGGAVISDAGTHAERAAARVPHCLPARHGGERRAELASRGRGDEARRGDPIRRRRPSVGRPGAQHGVLLPRLPGRCGDGRRRPSAPDVDGGHARRHPGRGVAGETHDLHRVHRRPRDTGCAPTFGRGHAPATCWRCRRVTRRS